MSSEQRPRMNPAIEPLLPLFHTGQKFVLTTHVSPDGDGLGSEVALAEWLASRGKQVSILNHSATPAVYLFLDPNRRITQFVEERDAALIARADTIVVLDTNHPDRLRSVQPHVLASTAMKICIDHHLEPASFAQQYLIDDDATSTGELVYGLIMSLDGSPLTPLVAQALYCAIMTDTGSFRYPRVDPEIYRIAAHLIECGADPVEIFSRVHEQWSNGRIHLLGEMLAGLKTEFSGKLAHVSITQEMLRRTGTTEEDTDNFTTYPMSVAGVVAGILFLELPPGVKISFRSKGDVPINELAKLFGGNGHKNAAGARVYDASLDDIRRRVLEAAGEFLNSRVDP